MKLKVEISFGFVSILGLSLGLFAVLPTAAIARSLEDTLYHRTQRVPVVVVARVLTKSPPRHDGRNNWHHDHTIAVERVLKGKVSEEVAVRTPRINPAHESEEGDTPPDLKVGRRYVLLLKRTDKAGHYVVPWAHSEFPATEEMGQALDLACHPEKWSWGPAVGGLQFGAMVEGTYWHNEKWYAEMTTALRNRTEKPITLEFQPKLAALSGTVTDDDAEHPLRIRSYASAGEFTVPAGGIAVIDNAGGSTFAQQVVLPGERDATGWKVNLQCVLGAPGKKLSGKLKSAPIRITGAGQAEDEEADPVVIADAAQLDKHLGDVVTLRGELSDKTQKVPTVLGVMVIGEYSRNLVGEKVEATGRLNRYTIKPDDVRPISLPPGTYYEISAPGDGEPLTVHVIKEEP